MNNKIIAIYNGITNIDDDLIQEALSDQAKDITPNKVKNTAKIKIVKILSVAASVVFIVAVLFPMLVANVSALGKIVETYMPEYFSYSQNFAIYKQSLPDDNLDKMIYYSELSDFHDLSTRYMRADFLDDVSVEEAEALLEKGEGLLNAASKGPISFLEYLGFAPDSYNYTVKDNYFNTDIYYSEVYCAVLSYFTDGVFRGIFKSYVINIGDKACFPCAKNEDNVFEILSTKKNENCFFTSIIFSGEKKYSVYYGIAYENEEKVIGYYWCQDYKEFILPEYPIPEGTENELEEMRIAATEYMKIRAAWLNDTTSVISYLGFPDEDICLAESIGHYVNTNINYADFYNKMLMSMTPELFEREFRGSYMELDGKLFIILGGGSGWDFDEVTKLIPTENGYYKLVARWFLWPEDEVIEEEIDLEMFFVKADNGWVVADYKTDTEENKGDVEKMRTVANEYMKIRSVWLNDSLHLIRYLGFSNEDIHTGEFIDGCLKTNIDYAEFYNKMLMFMTSELFEREFGKIYMELDGELLAVQGEGSGWDFDEVTRLIPTENGYYKLVACWFLWPEDEIIEKELDLEMFFVKSDNGWVVADYKTD